MNDDFPENFLKGIPREDYLLGDSVQYTLFMETQPSKSNEGWKESSINWEIDAGAVKELLSRKKDNELHFKGGLVRIPKEQLDRIIDQFKVIELFSYEKRKENGNAYHGNLLFNNAMTKTIQATICGALSRAVINLVK